MEAKIYGFNNGMEVNMYNLKNGMEDMEEKMEHMEGLKEGLTNLIQ